LLDINNPGVANSNWVVPQRLTMNLFYSHAFFGDNETRISLQGFAAEGQPQSYVMSGGDLEGDGFFGRHLLYVPTGTSDPNVCFQPAVLQGAVNPCTGSVANGDISAFNQAEFGDFVSANGLAPGFTKRNDINTDWSTIWNLSIRQDISLGDRLRSTLYLKIKNLGNFLNDDWGKVTDAQFFSPEVIDADVNGAGQFVFNEFSDRSIDRVYIGPSLWEVRMGIDINFGQ
jgi:hypothetical protein